MTRPVPSVRATLVVAVLVFTASIAVGATPAVAAPGDATAAEPILPGGLIVGTARDVSGSTTSYNGTAPCGDTGSPHASLYSVAAGARRYLQLSVSDDAGGSTSLCRIDLMRAGIDDPFDAEQRAAATVATADGCAATSTCSLAQWIDASVSYLVVLWRDVAEHPHDRAEFAYTARLRTPPPAISLSITGHRFRDCRAWNEVVSTRPYTLSVSIATAGTVVFTLDRPSSGSWIRYRTYVRALSSGRATWSGRGYDTGTYRFSATYQGSDTVLPGTRSSFVFVRFVTIKGARYNDGGIRLSVPFYRQQYNLSCELASYRMAYNYFHPNAIDSDLEVLRVVGVDRRRPAVTGGCNPDRWFCGNVDGIMMRDGYGVHVDPMARAARSYNYCRPPLVLRGSSYTIPAIARALNDGFPVVAWGAHRGPSGIVPFRWRAWDGHLVYAYSVEHTWTVVGFHGSPSRPTSFIVHDPARGGFRTFTAASFAGFVKYFKTALVVRG